MKKALTKINILLISLSLMSCSLISNKIQVDKFLENPESHITNMSLSDIPEVDLKIDEIITKNG